jgi:hypothetical protein
MAILSAKIIIQVRSLIGISESLCVCVASVKE